ncbi:SMP-30/gluconolactonase/LRE family protein [uncultured Maribacter sp.]|uniref:SMP-30/gluconolactonase/LRE family protein n=1 Tax=uncultured Maribacter sp. TaxID=431308 RepID=UPI002601A3B7|nr:SMP-30/gluconolactonase/LRE family protein [uncultured Maribacter sp.]
MKQTLLFILCITTTISSLMAQNLIPLNTENWKLEKGEFIDFDNRKCLIGKATLKKTNFKNGTIEFDIWLADKRSYPGIHFRKQNNNYEFFYFRPHRFFLYDDALQYAPTFKGDVCWQLYSGEGYTSKLNMAYNKWVHVKLVVVNDKAQVYVDDMTVPSMTVHKLITENKDGALSIVSGNRNSYISNFIIKETGRINSQYLNKNSDKEKSITQTFQLSKKFPKDEFKSNAYPKFNSLNSANWETVDLDDTGLLNISKYRKATKKENCIYVKSIIKSDKDKVLKLAFGYSDAAKIYFNKQLIYSGNYAFRSRVKSFAGFIGLNDTLYLNLKKGLNELFIKSSETFGGWGLKFKGVEEIKTLNTTKSTIPLSWNLKVSNLSPESVLYSKEEAALYVTNFNNFAKNQQHRGFISKLSATGEMLDSLWITGLKSPTGICNYKDKMFVVDRDELVEISIKKRKIVSRYTYPEHINFANDVVADHKGRIYITNSDKNNGVPDILILKKDKIIPWIRSNELVDVNGICFHDDKLIVGNGGDSSLKQVVMGTKNVSNIVSFGSGIVDGIKIDSNGNYLVSIWEGSLYKVNKNGEVKLLINGVGKFNIADFEYNQELQTLYIPTFLDNSVRAYSYK